MRTEDFHHFTPPKTDGARTLQSGLPGCACHVSGRFGENEEPAGFKGAVHLLKEEIRVGEFVNHRRCEDDVRLSREIGHGPGGHRASAHGGGTPSPYATATAASHEGR